LFLQAPVSSPGAASADPATRRGEWSRTGIPPLHVARILGHSSVTTTMMIYAHAMEEQTSPRAAQVMKHALPKTDAERSPPIGKVPCQLQQPR
jgi:hypothetical protein